MIFGSGPLSALRSPFQQGLGIGGLVRLVRESYRSVSLMYQRITQKGGGVRGFSDKRHQDLQCVDGQLLEQVSLAFIGKTSCWGVSC